MGEDGCNDAFVIDAETRNNLIAADPRSSDVIRKVLGGKTFNAIALNGLRSG